MSTRAMAWALGMNEIAPPAKFVLLAMADSSGQDSFWSDSLDSISRFTNLPVREVAEQMLALRAAGLMTQVSGGWQLSLPPEAPPPSRRIKAVIPASLRAAVFSIDGNACLACGATDNLTADHITPEKNGGPTIVENLQTLCRSCNSKKGVKTINYRAVQRA